MVVLIIVPLDVGRRHQLPVMLTRHEVLALGVVPHERRRLHQDVLRAARPVVEGLDEVLLLVVGPQSQVGLRRDAVYERKHVFGIATEILVGHTHNLRPPIRADGANLRLVSVSLRSSPRDRTSHCLRNQLVPHTS